jgi:3-methylfumaryl-CoA hydratase
MTGPALPIDEWRGATGRQIAQREMLDITALQRFASAAGLDCDGGSQNVPLAHWAFFLPCPSDAQIGPDGHPQRGEFLPAITLPRRMFAASSMIFESPIETGIEGELTSTIADVSHKSGRSGDLVFVEVEKRLSQQGRLRLTERQTYVYRAAGDPFRLPEHTASLPEGRRWTPNEVNLFRFSAATFNGHRIHYDHPYATGVEGYPALVVHGPFTAVRLAGLAMEDGPLASFAFRALAPLFVNQPIVLRRAADNEYQAVRCDGTVAMTAKATR